MLKSLHLSRVAWVEPLLWYACFALVLERLARGLRGGVPLAVGLIALQLAVPFFSHEFYGQRKELGMTYREFFSPELFREIREHVGRPLDSYRVVSIGLPPGIASYNGFYTLDGYVSNYPLEYKHRFRRLIAAELAKRPEHRRRFDQWGSHCFVYVAELPQPLRSITYYGHTRDARPRRIRRLELDRDAMQDLGLDYALSAVQIGNPRANGLVPRGVFERGDSPWRIFLYERAEASGPRQPGARRSGAPARSRPRDGPRNLRRPPRGDPARTWG